MKRLGELALLPRVLGRLAWPARRAWEWVLCRLVRCGWWCDHEAPSRIPARATLAAALLAVSALLVGVVA